MPNIWIVWATGAVWVEMIKCLKDLNIFPRSLKLWASSRSAWKIINTPLGDIRVEEVNEDFFSGLDYALFSAWWSNSKKFIPMAIKKWVRVIDNSSAFRYYDNIPLVVPWINSSAIWDSKIVANPNCTTAIAAVILYPIYKEYGIKKIIMSTYQASSWAWAKGMYELENNTRAYLEWKSPIIKEFSDDLAFNAIPHIDAFQDNWYTKEEMKVSWETKKIFQDNDIDISCTCVRIWTLRAHSESIVLETDKRVDIENIKKILKNSPWVELVDDIENNIYPKPRNATWKYDVQVWRIRKNLVFWNKWVELFLSWDQLLRWAALNAVEILKEMMKN